jgi:hypothetical protein
LTVSVLLVRLVVQRVQARRAALRDMPTPS